MKRGIALNVQRYPSKTDLKNQMVSAQWLRNKLVGRMNFGVKSKFRTLVGQSEVSATMVLIV